MTARKREPREITLAEIEQQFELAAYWFGEKWCPAVDKTALGYRIRVLKSETVTLNSRTETFDEFVLDADGNVTTAPRGWAKAYKPGRVTDIEAAAAQYEAPQTDARRIV
jgi:hypothetical protein